MRNVLSLPVQRAQIGRKTMRTFWNKLRRRDGQGVVEYAFILILVVFLCIAGLSSIGEKTADPIANVANAMP